jgi:hypothetical protein
MYTKEKKRSRKEEKQESISKKKHNNNNNNWPTQTKQPGRHAQNNDINNSHL